MSLKPTYLRSPGLALVTGANRGIGLAITQRLAAQGKRVLAAGRNEETSATAADAVSRAAPGSWVEPVALDISSPQSIAKAVAKLQSEHGRTVDVLINNAAILRPGWSAPDLEPTLRTNLDGTVGLTLAFAESLAPPSASGALVVCLSSDLGQLHKQDPAYAQALRAANTLEEVRQAVSTFRESAVQAAIPPSGTYALSKAALNRAVQLLARDKRLTESGVHVVACCPGWCRTDMGFVGHPDPEDQPTRSADQGAQSVLWWLEHFEPSLSGAFNRDGAPLAW